MPQMSFSEIPKELFSAYAADVRIGRVSGDILQVVQVAEHAHLTELSHPCQEGELDIPVH